MSEVRELLARRADWQRSRGALSWAEKIRMVEAIRESVVKLRRAVHRTRIDKPTPEPPRETP